MVTHRQILLPLHMPNHCGLVYFDLLIQHYTLMMMVPFSLLSTFKQLLDLLIEMFPANVTLQTKVWEIVSCFQRFGMPVQVSVDSRKIGMGTGGVGVIMAAGDLIVNGPSSIRTSSGNTVRWMYTEEI